MSERERAVGRWAWVMAWVGLVVGQLHALSRFATVDGREDLELPLVRAWAVPAASVLRPLLTWADPDVVYLTYGKVWLPVFAAFTLCAFTVRRHRAPAGVERWAWRLALTGYVGAVVGVAASYWTQWGEQTAVLDAAFLFTLPAVLITLVGSSLLGAVLLRRHARPRPAVWLLALTLPLAVALVQVTSMGSAALPVAFAFAIIGRQSARGGGGLEDGSPGASATDSGPVAARRR